MKLTNWIDVEVTNEEVIIHKTARLMKDGNYYIDARIGGDVILNGIKYEIDQVVEVKLSINKDSLKSETVYCPGHAAPVVNGYCFDCGLPRAL